ncbi:armadillo-type protein [Radiomyces spectabilis]|uniref:armadillo-type protein n=1 Tax=Radiomyces spectabilis TaxID=64574 RepID=UPI002220F4A1|nr:armadillo-type protein [Radiomyces spectabilis]KAI8374497.1 armadillo-type protein [Radiomyces spectabilis]
MTSSITEQLHSEAQPLLQLADAKALSENAQSLVNVLNTAATAFKATSTDGASEWSLCTQIAKMVADGARSESVRSPLGEAGIIGSLATLIQLGSGVQVPFQIQALRVFGNLCFDHEENRKRVHEAGIVPLVMPFLAEGQPSDLIQTACGFCLNCSMDYEPIEKDLANYGGVQHLSALLDPARMEQNQEAIVSMAAKVLNNLTAEDVARKIFSNKDSVIRVLDLIKYAWQVDHFDDLDFLENLADLLLQAVLDDDAVQCAVIDAGYLSFLLEFLQQAALDPEEDTEENKKQFEEIQKTISKATIYITSPDAKLEEFYNDKDLLSRFIDMAKSDSEVVHQCAVYILGNLARTDAHCIDLVENHHLEKLLLSLFQSTENATFQYAILGCLKHLCLPKHNKAAMGEAGTIDVVAPMLDASKDMLKRNQFLTIGILKMLCAGNYKNAESIISSPVETENEDTPLALVLGFIKRVDDVGAKSEATRILANLVKTVWCQGSMDLRPKLVEPSCIDAIMELVRTSKFVVLKNDGIMALTLIFADHGVGDDSWLSEALSRVVMPPPEPVINAEQDEEEEEGQKPQEPPETRSFLEVLTIDATTYTKNIPNEVRCNACTLLQKIVEAALKVNDKDVLEKLKGEMRPRLASIDKNESAMVGDALDRLKRLLEKEQ